MKGKVEGKEILVRLDTDAANKLISFSYQLDTGAANKFVWYCFDTNVSSQVPLTQSLYVPGKVVEPDKMLVDVGTGYYVEKDQQKTVEFLERKVGYAGGCTSPFNKLVWDRGFESTTRINDAIDQMVT